MAKDVCEVKECPDCASGNVLCDSDRQQVICRDCGLIYEPLAARDEDVLERASGSAAGSRAKRAKPKARKK